MTQRSSRPTVTGWLAAALFVGFFTAFFIWPILHSTRGAFIVDGEVGLGAFTSLLSNPGLLGTIVRAAQVALAATLAASALALPAAFLIARYRFPGRAAFGALVLVPLVLPPFVGAIGLKRLLGRFGTVNLALMELFGLDAPPVDWLAWDLIGVVILHALHLYPILYLIVHASFRKIDVGLEEAARNLGLSARQVFTRVFLPLIAPAYFAGAIIVFVWAFTDVGTPLLMGVRDVVAVRIFEGVSDIGENPAGYALVLIVVAISIGAFVVARLIAPATRLTGSTKGATRLAERTLGPVHTVLAIGFLGSLVTAALLPHVGVVLLSVAERWFLTALPSAWTTAGYTLLWEHPLAGPSIQMSVSLAGLATLIDLGLGTAIAHGSARGTMPGARYLDALAMAPLAVPGIVLAFGLVSAFSDTPLDPVTRSPFILLMASYAVRRLPFAVRSISAGFAAIPTDLEEAARNLGLVPRRVFALVTLPLLAPHLLAGALLTFVFAAVEVSDSLVLAMKPEHYPMTKAIWALLGRLDDGPMLASAMGVLVMLLLASGFLSAGALLRRRGARVSGAVSAGHGPL